jgi:hypothetical protein
MRKGFCAGLTASLKAVVIQLQSWLGEYVSVLRLACWHCRSETNSGERLEARSPQTSLGGVRRSMCGWPLQLQKVSSCIVGDCGCLLFWKCSSWWGVRLALDGVAGDASSWRRLKLACRSWPARFGMNLETSQYGGFDVTEYDHLTCRRICAGAFGLGSL